MEERGGRRKEATGNKNHLIPSTILSNTFNVCDAPGPPPPTPEVTTVNCWPGLPYVHTHGSEKVEVQTLGPDCVDLTCVILGSK